jgi:hypothetical protein
MKDAGNNLNSAGVFQKQHRPAYPGNTLHTFGEKLEGKPRAGGHRKDRLGMFLARQDTLPWRVACWLGSQKYPDAMRPWCSVSTAALS